MRFTTKTLLAALLSIGTATAANAEALYGISSFVAGTQQRLFTIESSNQTITSTVNLPLGVTLRSIDVRPATGVLYGIEFNTNQLYTINPSDGSVTALGAPLPVSGAIDFNPVADAIRLIGRGSNANYRINANTGAVIMLDGQPAYDAGDTNFGDAIDIRTIGYTNSVAGAATTVLYDVDVLNDVLATQTPANGGNLQTRGAFGVNLNGGTFGTFTGFDISGQTGMAYLVDSPAFGGPKNFYTVNLATGAASLQGVIQGFTGAGTVADIAVIGIPEPASLALVGLAAIGGLSFGRKRQ